MGMRVLFCAVDDARTLQDKTKLHLSLQWGPYLYNKRWVRKKKTKKTLDVFSPTIQCITTSSEACPHLRLVFAIFVKGPPIKPDVYNFVISRIHV